jgi:hypothetical protein
MAFSHSSQFHNEDFWVLVGNGTEANRGIDKALELLGGKAVEVSPVGGLPDVPPGSARGIIASLDALAASSPALIEALRRCSKEIPLLVFPALGHAGLSHDAARVLRALGAPELAITPHLSERTGFRIADFFGRSANYT